MPKIVKITVPPMPTEPEKIGEIDIELVERHGRVVHTIGKDNWSGLVIDIPGGSLVYVPSVKASEID